MCGCVANRNTNSAKGMGHRKEVCMHWEGGRREEIGRQSDTNSAKGMGHWKGVCMHWEVGKGSRGWGAIQDACL